MSELGGGTRDEKEGMYGEPSGQECPENTLASVLVGSVEGLICGPIAEAWTRIPTSDFPIQ